MDSRFPPLGRCRQYRACVWWSGHLAKLTLPPHPQRRLPGSPLANRSRTRVKPEQASGSGRSSGSFDLKEHGEVMAQSKSLLENGRGYREGRKEWNRSWLEQRRRKGRVRDQGGGASDTQSLTKQEVGGLFFGNRRVGQVLEGRYRAPAFFFFF